MMMMMINWDTQKYAGRYNSVRQLQRQYLELPSLRGVSIVHSIVTSSVPISVLTQVIHLKARYSCLLFFHKAL